MAVRVLEGADISTIAVETQKDFAYTINDDMADILGITILDNIQEIVINPAE